MKKFNKDKINIRSSDTNQSNLYSRSSQANPWSNSSFSVDLSGQYGQSSCNRKFNQPVFPQYDQAHNKINIGKEIERRMSKEMKDRGLNTDIFNPNSRQNDEQILFSSVLGKASAEATEFLKTTNVDTNIKDYWGNNVLIVLCLKSEINTLLNILNDCAENFSENTLYDFLIYIVSTTYNSFSIEQQSDILRKLLQSTGEEILNKIDEFGNTVIMHSVENYCVLETLLENKCVDLSITNLCGNNPISYCVESGLEESLGLLLNHIKINCSKEKQKEILNQKNFTMQTPLMLAVESKSTEIVKTLLKTKLTDVNCKNYEGKTPLLYSIEQELTEITELILNVKDVDINVVDNYKNTPITKAIESGNHKLTLSLLSKMANLDMVDSIGRSPLLHLLNLKYCSPKFISNKSLDISPFDLSFAGTGGFDRFDGFCGFAPYASSGKSKFDIFSKKNKLCAGINDEHGLYNVIATKLINSDLTNVNVSDIQGSTPMTLICNNEDIFLFDILMADKKYDVHKKNIKGVSDYEYIKAKYETMACNLFGSEKYCPIKTCPLHKRFNDAKEEAKIIKETAKEIEEKLKLNKHDEDTLSIEDSLNDEEFPDFDVSFNCNGFSSAKCCTKYINQDNFNDNSQGEYIISNNLYLPDVGPNMCGTSFDSYKNKILTPIKKVSEIEIKKFSVLKYFYEQMEKINNI